MKFLMSLAITAAMMFIISPLPAQEIVGYEQVCNGSTCSYRPIYAAPRFVKTVHFAGIAEADTAQLAAPTIRLASLERDVAAPVIVSASAPVMTASICNCSVTGICSCDPATCACPSCANGRKNIVGWRLSGQMCDDCWNKVSTSLQASPSMSAMLPGPSERIINTPTGHVHVFTDALGNVATMHSGGHQQRRVARQERWRGRNGIQ